MKEGILRIAEYLPPTEIGRHLVDKKYIVSCLYVEFQGKRLSL